MNRARNPDSASGEPIGWIGSLRFRLAASVIIVVTVGMALSLGLGYLQDYRSRLRGLRASLLEQAHSLDAARQAIKAPGDYADFVDEFCARMNSEVSPGHHILVLDSTGDVIATSHRHSGPQVGHALMAARSDQAVISLGDRELAQARLRTRDGSTIIVAQYLQHMESLIRRQLISRGISTALIGMGILVLLLSAMRVWVVKPLAELKQAGHDWSQRDFATRARPTGPRDIRSLMAEFNRMASELEAHESRRLAEMDKARKIQAGFLPAAVPEVAGLREIIARYEPAEDVAGDLYDIIPLADGRTAMMVLDVSGHGVSAALLTGIAKMALHWRMTEQPHLADAIARVNSDLCRCMTDGQFVTMCVGIWDSSSNTWTYCAAGHPGGALQTGDRVEHLPSTGPLLGAVEEAEWSERTLHFEPGQRLWLYTDGLIEAGAPDRKLDIDGLERVLRRTADAGIEEQASELMREAISRQQPEAEDDITIVGFECLSTHRPAEPEVDQ